VRAEFAAELKDFVEQEVPVYWPDLLPYIRIYILEASDRPVPRPRFPKRPPAPACRRPIDLLSQRPPVLEAMRGGRGRA
jgi:hypothetical protein